MRRVAFLTTKDILAGTVRDPSDLVEHRLQFQILREACSEREIDLVAVAWDDTSLDPASFGAIVIGTAWDYAARVEEFLDRLQVLSAARPLFNSLAIVRWNIDKSYLRDLEQRGVPTVPTLWRSSADAEILQAAFDELQTDHLVIKPIVGQAAWRQVQLHRGEPIPHRNHLPPKGTMIQPFQAAIQSEGEYSFLFIDGEYSHCVLKLPAAGDYRIQANFGGTDKEHNPTASDLQQARSVVAALEEQLLYARIDMVRNQAGGLALMECELIEPYLYPTETSALGAAFAAGLDRRLT